MSEYRPGELAAPLGIVSFDGALGRRIIAIHRWAVDQGLRGAPAETVFEGLSRRLVAADVPLLRAFAGVQTLHPQWAGHSYTWSRDHDVVEPVLRERGEDYERDFQISPFAALIPQGPRATLRTALDATALYQQAVGGTSEDWPRLRRRLSGPAARLDFPVLEQLAAAGATDYFAQIVRFGSDGDPSRGSGIGCSFATDRTDGFSDDDLTLIEAVLPAAALAIMSDATHRIASGLLASYIGGDAGARVHAGAVERGSVESIRAVLCFTDIRGWTAIADAHPGPALIELLDEVFETLVAPLRARGGQVLKFLGDGMLATLPFTPAAGGDACRRAIDMASEALAGLDRLNTARRALGKPTASIGLALHVGEVLYGNVGAIDRLDFTVIGPAVNEAARIEALCGALGRTVLVSAEFSAALGDENRLRSLGRHTLRGVPEPREIFALEPA